MLIHRQCSIKKLGDLAEVEYYSSGHFEIYIGENFERSAGEQTAFFKKHLLWSIIKFDESVKSPHSVIPAKAGIHKLMI